MKLHFWLSAGAITLTQESIGVMTEGEARLFLAELRWGSREQQVCPECGAVDRHYDIRTRKQWRCKHCFGTFSVTSGTPFQDHKLSYRKLVLAIFAFVTHQKGLAALELRRIIGGQYRTCFTLLHKIREAILATASQEKLSGLIEMDGAHFSGRKRKPRKKKPRPTPEQRTEVPAKYSRQLRAKNPPTAFPHHPNRRIVMVLREVSPEKTGEFNIHNGKPIGKGARRTIVAICRSENSRDVEALLRQHVAAHSVIHTDEGAAFRGIEDMKDMHFKHEWVNHSEMFSTDEGVSDNQAESFFSRLRRADIGIYHRIAPKYMQDYALEAGWREDVRRLDIRSQIAALMERVFRAGLSKDWINYCRGHHRQLELLYEAPPIPV